MFGAYQIGAWKVASRFYKPDIVVGVSIGSLNAWMVACGCSPEFIEEHWLEGAALSNPRLRMPRSWRDGLIDPKDAYGVMQRMYSELRPQIPIGIVVRSWPWLRPEILRDGQIDSWRCLAASCAIPAVFDQQRLNGKVYADGGLLDPLPYFAAREMGADEMLGINCMTWGGWGYPKAWRIQPRKRLGIFPTDALRWKRDKIERWIAQGEADAGEFATQYCRDHDSPQKTFTGKLF